MDEPGSGKSFLKTKYDISMDDLLLQKRLREILIAEPDPVKIQIQIELLMVAHAENMGNRAEAEFVIDSMAKHAKQLLHDRGYDA